MAAAIDDKQKEHLTDLTVDVVLEVRRQYLAAGANALRHWDQITERVRSATRTTTGPEEWMTKLLRDLQIGSPSSATAAAIEALTETARKYGVRAWLALVEAEYAFIVARARRMAEERATARLAAQAPDAAPVPATDTPTDPQTKGD